MAFQHALDVGSDLLELDCFLTADGTAFSFCIASYFPVLIYAACIRV